MTERDAIKEAVREAFKEELQAFYVDRETHYNHHKFLGDWIDWVNQCKSVAMKTVVGFFVITVVGLMIAGFMFKVGK